MESGIGLGGCSVGGLVPGVTQLLVGLGATRSSDPDP